MRCNAIATTYKCSVTVESIAIAIVNFGSEILQDYISLIEFTN